MPFPFGSTFPNFPTLASVWNPYQGVSHSYNILLGGIFFVAQNSMLIGGYPLYTPRQ